MMDCLFFCFTFLTAFVFSFFFIKILIRISIEKNVFDNPNVDRKLHIIPTPNIAGVAFFFSIIFCMSIFGQKFSFPESMGQILAANIILFLLGLKDDLIGLSSSKRFYGQLFSGLILIIFGDFRIQNLSIIGFTSISYPISIFISLLFFVMITNAYNLIDGLNGLLGSLTIFSCLCFLLFFYINSNYYLIALMISIIATILAFLFFNFGKASIFMGSSGSYVIGSLMYFNSITFLNQSIVSHLQNSKFSILFCILAIPIFDTVRVFILRIMQKKSPFSADANHIHHRLLMLLPSHSSVVCVIISFNILLVGVNFLFYNFNQLFVLVLDILILLLSNFYLEFRISKNQKFE
jgi:UDP-GlcNAc:undecaprenyl-phosphate GlcNAc-1-phosphate transferase